MLDNGNIHASILVGHSVHLKETYDNMKVLLTIIHYEDHNWMSWVCFYDNNKDIPSSPISSVDGTVGLVANTGSENSGPEGWNWFQGTKLSSVTL
ncbi:hypothetical protein J437_LFUL013258 [Ladona fulva]|uniref:Uncharacterized protein n=1 Tax=Ladona fulva TaxID=123851 RepID=A0A8K0KEB9_LADFU|nr:hypothetical protein J437_LFUL013258 [Ladona fulva]